VNFLPVIYTRTWVLPSWWQGIVVVVVGGGGGLVVYQSLLNWVK